MAAWLDIAPYVALGSAALSLALLIIVIVVAVRLRALRHAQTVVLGRHERRDLIAHADDLDDQVRNLRDAVEILTDELDTQRVRLDHALTHRAIVRYDAFRDAGGEQSASFALLDRHRSGVVLSTIAARDFARIYVKYLSDGVPDRELAPEEEQAVAAAVPQPLGPDEHSAPARRVHLPERRPPAALAAELAAEQEAAPGSATRQQAAAPAAQQATAPTEPAATASSPPSPEASAAFEALADAVASGGASDPPQR